MKKILIFNSGNTSDQKVLQDSLEELYTLCFCEAMDEAMRYLSEEPDGFAAVLIDFPSKIQGLENLVCHISEYNQYNFEIPILFLTDDEHVEEDLMAIPKGVGDFLERPFSPRVVRKRLERAISRTSVVSFEEFAEMLRVLPSNIYLKDAKARYVFSSQTWHHLDHYDDPNWSIVGKTDMEVRADKENAKKALESDLKIIETGESASYIVEENEDQQQEFLQVIKEPLFGKNGKVRGIIALINNVTEQELLRRELRMYAITDKLTGLYNRRYGAQFLEKLHETARSENRSYGVFCIDLNHFKPINDTYGHEMGDEVLREMGRRLKKLPECYTVIRDGGDEFTVLLSEIADEKTVTEAAERLQKIFSEKVYVESYVFQISASIGIALYPEHGNEPELLQQFADAAMYEVKKSENRASYRVFDLEMKAEVERANFLRTYMRKVEVGKCFCLFYQPIYDLRENRLLGAETYLRFLDSDMRTYSPKEMLTAIESKHTISELTIWELQEALHTILEWRRESQKELWITLNLLPLQLIDTVFFDCLAKLLEEIKLPKSCVVLDISDGIMQGMSDQERKVLKRLSTLGIVLALNEYDGGEINLWSIRELGFSQIKLSRELVQNAITDEAAHRIIEGVAALSEKMGLRVIAVGVETGEQREMLLRDGIECMQGYLFGKPVEKKEFSGSYL